MVVSIVTMEMNLGNMKVEIVRLFQESDLDFSFDPVEVLLFVDSKAVLNGSESTCIEEQISGFIDCLDHIGSDYNLFTTEENVQRHP